MSELVKNQKIELDITGYTAQGSGVGHYNGMAVFVPNTAKGDSIIAHVTKVKSNYAFARLDTLVSPSENRQEPDCPVFSKCGGCVFRHISYEAELDIKYNRVKETFERLAHINVEPKPIIGADTDMRYRNKAQYPVGMDKDGLKIGFYGPNSHRIIDCRDCKLQPDVFEDILTVFECYIKEYGIKTYNEITHKGLLRHIYVRSTRRGDIMVCAVVNGKDLPFAKELVEQLKLAIPGLKSVALNINREDTNVILGNECKILWGKSCLEDELCGYKFRISPLSFYQVNSFQAEKLYNKAAEYACLTGTETVVDLYCGAGTIGLTMANKAKRIIGVEIVPEAIEDAKINAEINGITNAQFIADDASGAARKLFEEGIRPQVVIVDPPRKGLTPELIETIDEMNPDRVVYVSCDVATLARDSAIFKEKGYDIKEVTPVDMFPRTAHVECCALLCRT